MPLARYCTEEIYYPEGMPSGRDMSLEMGVSETVRNRYHRESLKFRHLCSFSPISHVRCVRCA